MKRFMRTLALMLALVMVNAGLTALADASTGYNPDDFFTKRDLSGEWDAGKAATITLNGASAETDSNAVTVDGGAITVSEAGVYIVRGALDDGSIVVDVGDEDKVQLVLDGASITSSDSAAILVENADKVFVTLAEGTRNTLANGGAFDDEVVDAAIFAHDDLVINGAGSLTVDSPAGHGIVGKDDVKLVSGDVTVTAGGRGVDANDSLLVAGGSYVITAGKDAMRCKNDDADKGVLIVFDGTLTLTSGGGADNGAAHTDGMRGFGRPAASADEGSSSSTKGLKASGDLIILGGSITADCADDTLHTDADMTVYGGTLTLASGDDGMHANGTLTIEDGVIAIARSYEGIEGQAIVINSGDITVNASDDGLNAAGGNDASGYGFHDMFASQDGVSITINGGGIHVNASGDGIDSNGDLFVNGGSVVVSGPTNSGNGALDYNGTGAIAGGTVVAAGASGMAESFGSDSTQVSALVNLSGQAGAISVADAGGNVILTAEVEKSYDCVVVSCPQMAVGDTITVSNADGGVETELTSVSNGGMGGFGGRMGGNRMGGQMNGGMGNGTMNNGGMGGGRMNGAQDDHAGGRQNGQRKDQTSGQTDDPAEDQSGDAPELPEGAQPPEGMEPPEGDIQPPEGMEPPEGMQMPQGGFGGPFQGMPGGQAPQMPGGPNGQFPGNQPGQTADSADNASEP